MLFRSDQAAVDRINDLGDYARHLITEVIGQAGIDACVTGKGSMFRIHLKSEPPVDYRSAYMYSDEQHRINQLVTFLFETGFLMINTCTAALSTVMGREQVDQLAMALAQGLVAEKNK